MTSTATRAVPHDAGTGEPVDIVKVISAAHRAEQLAITDPHPARQTPSLSN
jgi:hypothetical protein